MAHAGINSSKNPPSSATVAKLPYRKLQTARNAPIEPSLLATQTSIKSPEPCLKIALDARFLLASDEQLGTYKMIGFGLGNKGTRTQCHNNKNENTENDVVLGIDFGTSSTKIVIGDAALEKAFAVPFFEANGISEYLLPSRLYETTGAFSFHRGTQVHRDLKLALIDNISDTNRQNLVIAFLALAIRHSRAWLFENHQSTYAATILRWKLVVGLPVAHHLNDEIAECFRKIADLAWLTANTEGV